MDAKKKKILEVTYKSFMDLMFYSNDPVDLLDNYVAEDVMGYGTALDEKILDIEGLKDLAILQRDQAPDLKFKYELTPVYRNMMNGDNTGIIVDEINISMNVEGEEVILNVRMSSVWQMIEGNWKIIHWHGSKPEYDSGGSDTWHKEEWTQKQAELEKQVQEKTEALQKQNHDLEIEASLERVRTIAMSMNKPDDLLDVCQIISEQLVMLNVSDIRNVQVAIIDEQKKTYLNYQFFTPYAKKVFEETAYENNPASLAMVTEMQKSVNSFFIGIIQGEELKEFKAWRNKKNQFPDPLLDKYDVAYYYFYSIGQGGLGLTTYEEISKESLEIFKRFHKVFTLAYQRFMDIQQATAQAKEARIEASLERVRSVAMSMLKSNELLKVCESVFNELRSLGFNENNLRNTQIIINNDEKEFYSGYQYSDYTGGEIAEVPYDMHPIIRMLNEKLKKSTDAFADIEIFGKAMDDWKSFVKSFPQKPDKKLNTASELHYYFYSVGIGALGISSFKSLSEEKLQILQRLRNVFNLSYQRYVDMAQAEAQAREAQIQLCLERVRSRTMAMQHSTELAETSLLLLQQFQELGDNAEQISIAIVNDEEKEVTVSATLKGNKLEETFTIKIDEQQPVLKKIYNAWKSNKKFVKIIIEGEELKDYNRWRNKLGRTTFYSTDENAPSRWIINIAPFSNGMLSFSDHEPASSGAIQLLERFAAVFDGTYTRFLDLKKAEERAREAQIETALEKVRARAMSMQKPDELKEVAVLLRKEMGSLGVEELETSSIYLVNENSTECWYAIKDVRKKRTKLVSDHMIIQLKDTWVGRKMEAFYHSKQNQTSIIMKGDNRKEWINYSISKSSIFQGYQGDEIPERTYHLRKFAGGYMGAASPGEISSESWNLLQRSAKVFSLAYTRFKELQQAAERAREAQIELALERVRARTMAMQNSEELADLSFELVRQVHALGIDTWFCAFNIYDEDTGGSLEWGSNMQGTYEAYRTPREGIFLRYYEAGQKGETLLINEIDKDQCPAHYEYLCSLPGVGEQLLAMKDAGIQFPTSQIDHVAFFKYGYILFITFEPVPEAYNIFKRFAKVFEQTYTRFLDLQKSEAQARDAQIEAVLERVRSRTMAMQQSEEMPQVANNLFLQVKELGFPAWSAGYCIWESDTNAASCSMSSEGVIQKSFSLPTIGEGYDFLTPYKSGEQFYVTELGGDELVEHYKFMRTLPVIGEIIEDFKQKRIELPTFQIFHIVYFKHGYLMFITYEPVPEAHDVFKRLARVFEQTYTRFLDLKKAEERAREAQIETGLERARAQSMMMQYSSELNKTSQVFHEQLYLLGIDSEFSYLWLPNEAKNEHLFWATWKEDQQDQPDYNNKQVIYPLDKSEPAIAACYLAWESGNPVHVNPVPVQNVMGYFAEWAELLEGVDKFKPENYPEGLYYVDAYMKYGCFGIMIRKQLSVQEQQILHRFSMEFERAYTRFLDLKKAEEQTREAQIELSLERIRAQVTAMQESSELLDIVVAMRTEFVSLGHEAHYFWYMHYLPEIYEKAMTSGDGTKIGMIMTLPRHIHGDIKLLSDWEKSDEPNVIFAMDTETAVDYVDKMITLGDFKQVDPQAPTLDDIRYIGGLTFVMARTSNGEIGFSLPGEVPNPPRESLNTLTRFAKVFDLAYSRFEDLKSAEHQNRETQIELALERVRSKTMAMHNSNDMAITVTTLFEEVLKLGLDDDIRCGIGILEGTERMETRSATLDSNGEVDLKIGMLDMTIHPLLKRIKNGWKRGETHYVDQMAGKDVKKYYTALNNEPDYPFHRNLNSLPEIEYHNSFSFPEGIIFAFSPNPMTEEAAKVFERFARVFGQTYRRYRDLQKAEMQAREAQVEAALERVRSQAMAMHDSGDLGLTVDTFFSELKGLNVSPHRCGVGIVNGKSRIAKVQAIDTNPEHESKKIIGDLKLTGHPVLDKIFKHWKTQDEYFPVLKGNEIAEYYKVMNPQVKFHEFADDEIQYGYYFYFKEGGVYAWTDTKLEEQDLQIFRKYTSVLSLTYRRYLDLKDAEAKAREAIKQSSLDRIRGKISSMRNATDLQQITPLIWNELIALEVPFFRCGIFIVNETKKHVQVYLTTPEGASLGVLDLDIGLNDLTRETVKSWRKNKVCKTHWSKEEFITWTQEMMKIRQVKNPEKYQGAETPPESLHLHFIPFAQGMLYVGNSDQLSKEQISLVRSLAEAFSFAYARYEDFVVLEEAKKRIEKTLGDLNATQSQLVHAEKMASLGELTAGIAHEIQNPLNFVNNFSEVSTDLIEELKEELKNGDTEEVNAIATDLLQNLEKINHHGKRASNIVKSMLEHSRTGSGEKQPTDINALTDEYLRLAYHGLQAKDKSFNAAFKLEADPSLPRINVVAQDLGRVLLNLINNAFHATNEKVKDSVNDYKPSVVVSTKSLNNQIEIRVQDNGNGIPDVIKDKIFQPFFTTKPTGQGTGLGLSMSYDIITKRHGGDLKVETKEGKGTEFIIVLPEK